MNREFYLIFAYCVMQSRSHAKYFFLRIGVGSFDGVRDFNASCARTLRRQVFVQSLSIRNPMLLYFLFGGGEGDFLGGGSF